MNISEYKNIFENEESHFYYVGYHQILLSVINKYVKKRKLKILDAGCGTGLFAKKLKAYGEVYGIDMSEEALEFAKKRGIKVKKASITRLPFADNTFDLVVSLDVLCHRSIKDDDKAIKEFKRVLKPKGYLVLKLPAFNWLYNNHDKHVFSKKRYTGPEIEKILAENNFKNLFTTYLGSFLVIPMLLKRHLEKISNAKATSSISQVYKPLNSLLVILFQVENLAVNSFGIPVGISFVTIAQKKNIK